MVRTKANNAAVRKAVAAKAPRKNLGGGGGVRSVSSHDSPSSRKGRKSKLGTCSNPIKTWPKPEWQKGIDIFLSPNSKGSSSKSSGSGSSSSSSKDGCSSSNSIQEDKLEESTATSDGEEIEKKMDDDSDKEMEEKPDEGSDEEVEEDLVTESEEESEMDEEEMASSKIAKLSKDLVCGSDDDD